jgi:hypothetical protein
MFDACRKCTPCVYVCMCVRVCVYLLYVVCMWEMHTMCIYLVVGYKYKQFCADSINVYTQARSTCEFAHEECSEKQRYKHCVQQRTIRVKILFFHNEDEKRYEKKLEGIMHPDEEGECAPPLITKILGWIAFSGSFIHTTCIHMTCMHTLLSVGSLDTSRSALSQRSGVGGIWNTL